MIDIVNLLNDYGIEYWTKGKNVADGFVNISCPNCGDKSNHGGFSLDGSIYMCWRCGKHDVIETLCLLLNKQPRELYTILKDYRDVDFTEKQEIVYNNDTIEILGDKLLDCHKKYLENRGFDANFLENKYHLKGTLKLPKDKWAYSYRIIIPVFYKGQAVSYLGRDFTNRQERYMTCKPELEVIPHKHILFNLDNCNYKEVIVVEGTFDAMKIGDNCCATFGTKYTTQQLALLKKKFDKIYVIYDAGEAPAQHSALQLCKEFKLMGGNAINITLDHGDPAEMTDEEVKELKKDLNL